jgi:two-component system response regulator BasR
MLIPESKDVLIVDRDDVLRRVLAAALTQVEVTCDTAMNPDDALVLLANTHYAVILIDLPLPVDELRQFVTTLRELEKVAHSRPVVMMMTGSARQPVADFGDEIQALLQKPFEVAEIADLIQGCVAMRRLHDKRKRDGTDPHTRLAIDKRAPRVAPPDIREH